MSTILTGKTHYISFTTTIFDDENDAVFYFGKLNDADNRLQLNSGDLMRHHVTLVKNSKIESELADSLLPQWDKVESHIKKGKKKDSVPDLLHHYLTALGDRHSKKFTYRGLKKFAEQWESTQTGWNITGYHSWLTQLTNWAKEFEEIQFPTTSSGSHRLAFDYLNGVYEQHKAILLAGKMAFLLHGKNEHFLRLLSIVEFWVVKGQIFPNLTDEKVPKLATNTAYGWIDSTCKQLAEKSSNYTTEISDSDASTILDALADKVRNRCNQLWAGELNWDAEQISNDLYLAEFNQKVSKLLLSRIELNRKGDAKTWAIDVEVEHVAPATWNSEWNDEKKGGGFHSNLQRRRETQRWYPSLCPH